MTITCTPYVANLVNTRCESELPIVVEIVFSTPLSHNMPHLARVRIRSRRKGE